MKRVINNPFTTPKVAVAWGVLGFTYLVASGITVFTSPTPEDWSPYLFAYNILFLLGIVGLTAFTYRVLQPKGISFTEYMLGVVDAADDEREDYLRYKAGFLAFHLIARLTFAAYVIANSFVSFSVRAAIYPLLAVLVIGMIAYQYFLKKFEVRRSDVASVEGTTINFPIKK